MGFIKRDKVYKVLQVETPDGQGGSTYELQDAGAYLCQVSYGDDPAEAEGLGVTVEQILHVISPVSFSGEEDAPMPSGVSGFSPTIDIKTETDTEYILHITDKNTEYDTPNLQGQDGEDGQNTVYVGTTPPPEGVWNLWVNPTEEDSEGVISRAEVIEIIDTELGLITNGSY